MERKSVWLRRDAVEAEVVVDEAEEGCFDFPLK
jgi:hypothetical protein